MFLKTVVSDFKLMFAAGNVLSKSEMVAPQLASQKRVFVGTPRHLSGTQVNVNSHVVQSELEQSSVGKEEDSVATYTADTLFDYAKDEEKTEEMELKVPKKNGPIIQKRVNFFENCFKTVCVL